MAPTRSDQSLLGRWWWTIDRWTLVFLAILIGFGLVLIQAATPAIAVDHGLPAYHFIKNQLLVLLPGMMLMLGISLLSPAQVRLAAAGVFVVSLFLVILTLLVGVEIKGATRWISVPILGSLQPTEIIKPAFVVLAAWLFARGRQKLGLPGYETSIGLVILLIALLLSQPDVGMSLLIFVVWLSQLFLAGISITIVFGLIVMGLVGLVAVYHLLPHVASRVDRFIDPQSGDNYQIDRALEAFAAGGLFGRGPGEGEVKMQLPDAHADFVFAVAGEELGYIWCLIIILLYALIIGRCLWRIRDEKSLFIIFAVAGLALQFGLQAFINMASALHLGPTKGMTLPFLSYGGSSLLGMCIGFGFLLALTRKRYGQGESS